MKRTEMVAFYPPLAFLNNKHGNTSGVTVFHLSGPGSRFDPGYYSCNKRASRLDRWEQHPRSAYEIFDKDGKGFYDRGLAKELDVSPSASVHAVLHDWIMQTDGKLSFLGPV